MTTAKLELVQVHCRGENIGVSDLHNVIESRVTIIEKCIVGRLW